MSRLTLFGKFWVVCCAAMTLMATGGALMFSQWAGLGVLEVPLAVGVFGASFYFYVHGVEAVDKQRTKERKRPDFPQDPYAP